MLGTDKVLELLDRNVDLSTTIERDMKQALETLTHLDHFDRREKKLPVLFDRRKANGRG